VEGKYNTQIQTDTICLSLFLYFRCLNFKMISGNTLVRLYLLTSTSRLSLL
jgi:hypothetical protein